jgi:hypothetical protein
MGKIKKYQPGGRISGNIPKSVKVDEAGTIKRMRKAFGLDSLKTPSRKKDVDLSAPGKGMMKELEKKGPMPASKKNVGRKGIKVKAKDGKSLKPVDSSKNPGLAKLPTPVRNKMGYQKNGGKMKAKGGAALKKQAATAIAMKKAGKSPKKAMGGMKMGKCKYGC